MASYGHPSLLFALQTLQALKTLQTNPSCSHQATSIAPFASPKTLQTSPCSQQPPRATDQSLLLATLASNRHPKATHQWLLMGIQGHTSMASYGHPSLPFHPAANSHPAPHINGFLWPLLQSTGTPGPHINGFLWASTSAVCQP